MTTCTDEYAAMSRRLMEGAPVALEEGDLVQAAEKLWGTAAQMVKSVAETRGWPHGSHQELFRVTGLITQETGDLRMRDLFHISNSLHMNTYEHWMSGDDVEQGLQRVQELIEKLEVP